jgi:hypothetical protein
MSVKTEDLLGFQLQYRDSREGFPSNQENFLEDISLSRVLQLPLAKGSIGVSGRSDSKNP